MQTPLRPPSPSGRARAGSLPAPSASSDLLPALSRNERWIQASDLAGRRAHALPGCSYRELRARGEVEAPSEAIVQIDKDVPRTFGELDDASAAGCRRALRAALLAFVVHEPDLGYCQVLIPPPLIVVHPLLTSARPRG